MENILKGIDEEFGLHFSPESVSQTLKLTKHVKYLRIKSQEENAGTEKEVLLVTVRGRATLRKQIFSKFHSVPCKGSSEHQLFYKDTGKRVSFHGRNRTQEKKMREGGKKFQTASFNRPSFIVV